MKKVDIRALTAWLDATLQAARFKDYAPTACRSRARPTSRTLSPA